MIKKWNLPLILESMAILVGTVIGGGVFALPYVNIKSGLLATNIWLFFLCALVCLLHLIFGEIILRTKKEMRLPGYAGHYLSNTVKKFLSFTSVFSIAFYLLIYIILANKFLHVVMGDNLIYLKPYTFIFVWFVLNLFLFFKVSDVSRFNFILTFLLMGLMIGLSFLCFNAINPESIRIADRMITQHWYVAYGVILFSLDGLVAVPMMFKFLKKKNAVKTYYSRSIVFSFIFIFLLFSVFMNSVALLSKNSTTIDTFAGLVPFLGRNVLIFGAYIGLLAVVTSYIVYVNYYKDMLQTDIKCNKFVSIFISMFVPLLFLLLDVNKLDNLMSLAGGVIGGMILVVLLFIYQKVRDKKINTFSYRLKLPNWFLLILGVFCFVGAISQIVLHVINK